MCGTDLTPELEDVDSTINTTLNRIATGMTEFSRQQAAMGVRAVGVGLRSLKDLAVPAELAAKLTAQPKIAKLSAALTTAGLTAYDLLLKHVDTKIAKTPGGLRITTRPHRAKCTPNTYAANH